VSVHTCEWCSPKATIGPLERPGLNHQRVCTSPLLPRRAGGKLWGSGCDLELAEADTTEPRVRTFLSEPEQHGYTCRAATAGNTCCNQLGEGKRGGLPLLSPNL